ncbi:MAG: hypothetical protein HOV97_05300 [Nonomuraea sp.]|nr:hypothetical protein [Nonomuraea sp.]
MSADPEELSRESGLEPRYFVKKLNDASHKHDDCRFFVLDPQHDHIARVALQQYANTARAEGLDALADDLDAWLREVGDVISEERERVLDQRLEAALLRRDEVRRAIAVHEQHGLGEN